MTHNVLIVEYDPDRGRELAALVGQAGGRAEIASDDAEAQLRANQPMNASSACLLGPGIRVDSAIQILRRLRANALAPPTLAILDYEAAAAAAILRAGASETLPIAASDDAITAAIRRSLKVGDLESDLTRLKGYGNATITLHDLGGATEDMARAIALGERAASIPTHVLLEGEPGTGKRLLARAIHAGGDRAGAPYVDVDVAALDPSSVEHVLFDRPTGAYWRARGGNLVLRNIDLLPMSAQTRIATLMGHPERPAREILQNTPSSVRVLGTVSSDLLRRVKAGEFREDLFYRLNICPIWLPPLRRRREDIAGLARGFIRAFALESGRRAATLSAAAADLMTRYDWPGNLTELEREIYRAVLMADGPAIEPRHFQRLQALAGVTDAGTSARPAVDPPAGVAMPPLGHSQAPAPGDGMLTTTLSQEGRVSTAIGIPALTEAGELRPLEAVEADMIRLALGRYRGSMTRAAQRLGIGRSTLYRKIREFGLDGRNGWQ